MLGKGNRAKEPELFDYDPMSESQVAPTREVMFAFTDEAKATMLTPREIAEQCDRLASMAREIKTIAGTWSPDRPYRSVLAQVQAVIADNNWETRRLRRRAKQAHIDAKRLATPRFGQERMKPVDDAA